MKYKLVWVFFGLALLTLFFSSRLVSQPTRSVVVSTNAFLTPGKLPLANDDAKVTDSPVSQIDTTTVAVSNIVNNGTLTRGIATLSGTNSTTDWSVTDTFLLSLTANSTNTHSNIPTSAAVGRSIILVISADGTKTIDFAFPGGITTNWVSGFVRTPRNGQTTFNFANRGSVVDIIAAPDVFATADNQILGRTSGALAFAAPSVFGIAASSSIYSGTLVSVSNTVTETAIFTNSIPANALGTNKTVILDIIGRGLNNTGGTSNFTFKVYLGSTVVYNDFIAQGTAAAVTPYIMRVKVAAQDSAAIQKIYISAQRGTAGSPAVGTGRISNAAVFGPAYGAGTEDSTATLPFSLTVTPQHAVSTLVFDCFHSVMYVQ